MTENSSFEEERDGFERLRQHILSFEPKESSKAVKVAVEALDKELKKMERDEKLKKKFRNINEKANSSVIEEDLIKVDKSLCTKEEEDMEWQDVSQSDLKVNEYENDACKVLSERSISEMSGANIRVKSPLSAIAVALHASLCSKELGFICTGIPTDESSSGFAPAIRDLPSNVFIPCDWDKNPNAISIRYRKPGLGTRILQLVLTNESQIYIRFSISEESVAMTFPLEKHINFFSFKTALSNNPQGVKPALHYKALPQLFNQFSSTFDLGDVTSVGQLPSEFSSSNVFSPPKFDIPNNPEKKTKPRKDFETDLTPPGLLHNPVGFVPPVGGGNLMGPNHPMFFSPDDDAEYLPGCRPPQLFGDRKGMKPRFDPYGPPNGPTGLRGRGRRPGDPNPDHLTPPSNNIDPRNFYL